MTLGQATVSPNKGMKLTNLSEAPGGTEAPLRAFRRFAAVRTGSQLIPGVRRARGWDKRTAGCPGVVTALGSAADGAGCDAPKAWRITLLLGRAAQVTAVGSIPQVAQRN